MVSILQHSSEEKGLNYDVQFRLQYYFNFSSHLSVLSSSVDERDEEEKGRTSLLGKLMTYNSTGKDLKWKRNQIA